MARVLGEPDVDKLLSTLSARELREWKAASRLDPFPDQRLEILIARLLSMVYNRTRQEGESAKTAQEFIPDYALSPEQRQKKKAKKMKAKMKLRQFRQEMSED